LYCGKYKSYLYFIFLLYLIVFFKHFRPKKENIVNPQYLSMPISLSRLMHFQEAL